MDRVTRLGFVASVMGMLAMAPALQANVFLPDFTTEYDGTNLYPGDYTFGLKLVVGAAPISVTQLGFQDMQNTEPYVNPLASTTHDGLISSHRVGIWDSSSNLLGEVTVQSGTASALIGNWRYETLATPISLAAGQMFYIGADIKGDPFSWVFAVGDHPTDSAVGGLNGGPGVVHNNVNPWTGPGGDGSENDNGFLAPDTNGRAVNMATNAIFAVPEPASLSLLGLAGLALMRRRRA